MNQLIQTHSNENGNLLVSGRDLHEFLEIGTEYRKWFGRMVEYGFTENVDFVRVTQKCPTLGVCRKSLTTTSKLKWRKSYL
ncbi:antA/AntB antirepressor family protein [Paenibacillus larvae]|nr:antA/AntB antirepressor family protein [Paenibacillus larvae]